MPNGTIMIPHDARAAEVYKSASTADKRKLQALLSLWLRDLATGDLPSLGRVLDESGRKAKARGPIAGKLDSLLKGA